MSGVTYALCSAVAAAVTAILAKVGVEGVPSNLAYAIRTVVVIVFAWLMVFIAGEHHKLGTVSRRSLLSWRCRGWRLVSPGSRISARSS